MIAQLYPYLPYDDAETIDSYIRRMGQFHTGRDGHRLLADLGIDARRFAAGSDGAVSSLAAAAGVDPVRLRMRSLVDDLARPYSKKARFGGPFFCPWAKELSFGQSLPPIRTIYARREYQAH